MHHLEIFLVNGPPDAGPLRAFKNHCPHAGGPLNLFPDIFFKDGFLLCTRRPLAGLEPTTSGLRRGPRAPHLACLSLIPITQSSHDQTHARRCGSIQLGRRGLREPSVPR